MSPLQLRLHRVTHRIETPCKTHTPALRARISARASELITQQPWLQQSQAERFWMVYGCRGWSSQQKKSRLLGPRSPNRRHGWPPAPASSRRCSYPASPSASQTQSPILLVGGRLGPLVWAQGRVARAITQHDAEHGRRHLSAKLPCTLPLPPNSPPCVN